MADAPDGFVVRRLGCTDYHATWRSMQAFTDARDASTHDEIWLTEHPPVYTLGLAGRREHLRRETSIPVLKVDRGGQITYHGPGQAIAYVLIDLHRRALGVRALVHRIEGAVIELLGAHGLAAYGRADAPGVYVERDGIESKIAALGFKIRHGRTYHGVALNIDMDLLPFSDIDPCGYPGLAVTRLRDCGVDTPRDEIEAELTQMLMRFIAAPGEGGVG